MPVHYQTFIPAEPLQPFIRYFWVLDCQGMEISAHTFRAIVDGCPGAILVRSEHEAFCDEQTKKLPAAFLYGQTVQPVKLAVTGAFKAVGICFQPHALKSVFGLDAYDLTNTCVDMNLLGRKRQHHVLEQMWETASVVEQIEKLSIYVADHLKDHYPQTDKLIWQVFVHIVQNQGMLTMKEVQQQTGLSERSLERKFKQTIGIPPKFFSRICRFQQSMNQMRASNYAKLSDVAYENDYADQSHFIRVFKEFTGFSPLEFKKKSREVVENFPQLIQ